MSPNARFELSDDERVLMSCVDSFEQSEASDDAGQDPTLVTKAHIEGFYYKPRVDRELLRAHHE